MKREVPVTHIHRRSGFTLIELMLVVAIIGLLAAIAVPKFANLVIKAKEASTRGKLGSVRSAMGIYYADNEGHFPYIDENLQDNLSRSLVPIYLASIPALEIPSVPEHANGYADAGYAGSPDDLTGGTWYGVNTESTTIVLGGGGAHGGGGNGIHGQNGGGGGGNGIGFSATSGFGSGELRIMCTHLDSKGVAWSEY